MNSPKLLDPPAGGDAGMIRIDGASGASARDQLAIEEPLTIELGFERKGLRSHRTVAVTMRTPGHDAELAAGFLFGEGIVGGRDDVASIEESSPGRVRVWLRPGVRADLKGAERNFAVTSSCGVCGRTSLDDVRRRLGSRRVVGAENFRVSAETIHALPERLREAQAIFARTGGLHGAGLFDAEGRLEIAREDIGRHNAVDKVIGAAWLAGATPLGGRILLVSGRASYELMQKSIRAGIPVLAAVGAPSSLAVEMAVEFGATLAGFVRDGRFNIYAGAERIAGWHSPTRALFP